MMEWIAVTDSTCIVAEAFDAETETIYVRFTNGGEWAYTGCPPYVWEEFTQAGQSRGQYLNKVLKFKSNSRYVG